MSGPYGRDGGDDGGDGKAPGSGAAGRDGGGPDQSGGGGDAARPPRIPPPRSPADDAAPPPGAPVGPPRQTPDEDAPAARAPDDATRPARGPEVACGGAESPPAAPPLPEQPRDSPGAGTGEGTTPADLEPPPEEYDHRVLKSLLGAWALAACSSAETAVVEAHLSDCGACAEEALRLRDAVALLHPEDSLDLDPALRSQVLRGAMRRRPPRVPVPDWAAPYDAETSRLDALLRDMADEEWLAPVRLRWFDGRAHEKRRRDTTVAGVIAHLLAVDGAVAATLGLPDPLDVAGGGSGSGGEAGPATAESGAARTADPAGRTEEFWRSDCDVLRTPAARTPWRRQGHDLVRTASFASPEGSRLGVPYGDFSLPVRDALLDRAFECWMHAEDIATAIDYPYAPPQAGHLHRMIDLAARMLPETIARRRRTGLAAPPERLTAAGMPGRAVHLEVEGEGGGDWYIPLDSPAAAVRPADAVAHVALDDHEFCQLAAGRVTPVEAAAGTDGDAVAIRDVLFATAALSRM